MSVQLQPDSDEKKLIDEINHLETVIDQKMLSLLKLRYEKDKLTFIFDAFCFDCDFRPMTQIDIGTTDLAYKCTRCNSTVLIKKKEVV